MMTNNLTNEEIQTLAEAESLADEPELVIRVYEMLDPHDVAMYEASSVPPDMDFLLRKFIKYLESLEWLEARREEHLSEWLPRIQLHPYKKWHCLLVDNRTLVAFGDWRTVKSISNTEPRARLCAMAMAMNVEHEDE